MCLQIMICKVWKTMGKHMQITANQCKSDCKSKCHFYRSARHVQIMICSLICSLQIMICSLQITFHCLRGAPYASPSCIKNEHPRRLWSRPPLARPEDHLTVRSMIFKQLPKYVELFCNTVAVGFAYTSVFLLCAFRSLAIQVYVVIAV